MEVLKIAGIIVGALIVLSLVFGYSEHLKELKGKSIFSSGILLLLAIAEVLVAFALSERQSLGLDNFIALLAIAGVILIGCLIANIVNYGIGHSIFVTAIQIVSAVVALIAVAIIATLIDSALNNKKRTHN